ncbi:SH3-domain-containing protein [Meredithblackwellia eburnea MCA 4105]
MDRFNSLASQAKAKAEQGRSQLNSQIHKLDQSRHNNSSSASASASSSSPPPRSPVAGNSSSAFVSIDATEKEALFSLLDEYFQSRPQYASALQIAPHSPSAALTASSPAPPSRVSAPPKPPTRTGLGMATAQYDYNGEAEDLSFKEGDKILVLEKVSDDWWKGELRGQTGLFPSAYASLD